MSNIHHWLVTTHIIVGSVALLLFWAPVLSRKGGNVHVGTGRLFAWAMFTVAITAGVSSLMVLFDPIAIRRPGETLDPQLAARIIEQSRTFSLFLLMLSVLVFASVRHGLEALKARSEHERLRAPTHRGMLLALGLLATVVLAIGIAKGQILLIVFGGLSLSGAVGMWRDTRVERPTHRQLIVAHFSGLIGAGIGAHTAFFAFGGSRLLSEILTGQWQVIPWVLPAIVGTLAIRRLEKRWNAPPSPTAAARATSHP
jgi:hypothetical protein